MDVFLTLGVVLVVGLIGGKIARLLKLPNVSGYLVFGLLLGPSFFKYISAQDVDSLASISEVALSVIAFSIGSEFVIKDMLKFGRSIVVITLMEVIGAIAVVFALMFFVFKQPFAFSIVIASMSAATAPAAVLMVIRQYGAHGPLTGTILPVVALDDVFGIMAFGIAMSLARLSVGTDISLWKMLTQPVVEIVGSFILGAILGYLLSFLANKAADRDELQGISLAAIAIATGLSSVLGFSPLLSNIVLGTVLVNSMRHSTRVFSAVNDFVAPVYILFFTLAGASLDLSILSSVGIMGLGYILARAGGKFLGAYLGAKKVQAEDSVRKYLGLSLLPQGGISIGLSVLVRQLLPQYASSITTIIMFSVLIYEVSGPVFAKIALSLAGEIRGRDSGRDCPEDS